MIYALKIIYTHYSWYTYLKLYGTIGYRHWNLSSAISPAIRNLLPRCQSATNPLYAIYYLGRNVGSNKISRVPDVRTLGISGPALAELLFQRRQLCQVVELHLLGNTWSGNSDCVASLVVREESGMAGNRLDQGFHYLIRKRHRWDPYYLVEYYFVTITTS
jgi:hypothetical protein